VPPAARGSRRSPRGPVARGSASSPAGRRTASSRRPEPSPVRPTGRWYSREHPTRPVGCREPTVPLRSGTESYGSWRPAGDRPGDATREADGAAACLGLAERRCSDKHRRASLFLPGNQPNPGGLKGRGALGDPRRRKHCRPPRGRSASFGRSKIFRDHENLRFSDDSESQAARRQSRLEPCERARGPRAEVESAEGFLDPRILI